MGQALKMCIRCETKRDCCDCADLHQWIMDHLDAEPVRSGRCGMCKTHDNGHGRINLYSGGGWQTAICKGVENYEMVISHNGDHFATRIEYCPYCGERLDVE